MKLCRLALLAFIFAFQISLSAQATEIDNARYEFTSIASNIADRALANLGKRLKQQGFEQIVIPPSAKTRALAIAQLDGIYLSSDLTEGIFIKFGISPTVAAIRNGKIEVEDGTLFHGKIHGAPVAVFVKAQDLKRRSDLFNVVKGWLLAARYSRQSFPEFLISPTAFAEEGDCRLSNISAKIDSYTEPLSKMLGNSTAAQAVSGCVIGAIKTGWLLTGGLPEGVANFIYSPVSSIKRYWKGVTGTVDLISSFFRDFSGEASRAWDGFGNLPAAEKANIACQVVSLIGAGTLIAYVTGALGASEILNQIRGALNKIFEKIPGTPGFRRLSGAPTGKTNTLSALPERAHGVDSHLAIEKNEEALKAGSAIKPETGVRAESDAPKAGSQTSISKEASKRSNGAETKPTDATIAGARHSKSVEIVNPNLAGEMHKEMALAFPAASSEELAQLQPLYSLLTEQQRMDLANIVKHEGRDILAHATKISSNDYARSHLIQRLKVDPGKDKSAAFREARLQTVIRGVSSSENVFKTNEQWAIDLPKLPHPDEAKKVKTLMSSDDRLMYIARRGSDKIELVIESPGKTGVTEGPVLFGKKSKIMNLGTRTYRDLGGSPLAIEEREIMSRVPAMREKAVGAERSHEVTKDQVKSSLKMLRGMIVEKHHPLAQGKDLVVVGKDLSLKASAEKVAQDLEQFDEYLSKLGFQKPAQTRVILNKTGPGVPQMGPLNYPIPLGNIRDFKMYDGTIALNPINKIDSIATNESVVLHERAHSSLFAHYNDEALVNRASESHVYQEALADYLTASFRDSPVIGQDAVRKGVSIRNIEQRHAELGATQGKFRTVLDLGKGDPHNDALLYSNTLWQVRASIGREKMDSLIKPIIDDINRNYVFAERLIHSYGPESLPRKGPRFLMEADHFAYFLASVGKTAAENGFGETVLPLLDNIAKEAFVNPLRIEELRSRLNAAGNFDRVGHNKAVILFANLLPVGKDLGKVGAAAVVGSTGFFFYNTQPKNE